MSKNIKRNKTSNADRGRNILIIIVIAVFAIVGAAYAGLLPLPGGGDQAAGSEQEIASEAPKEAAGGGDLVIQVADITEEPSFIAYDGPDFDMEIIAVKASDGTIRTAFNTCQVCYSSGKGYYEQEGDLLVCQNCGNSFGMDDVEVTKGGCNPFPITADYKTETTDTITIPGEFLKEAQVIFENWKTNV